MAVDFSNRFIDVLKTASNVVVSTGAGVSAESGVPTFRGEDGIWKKMKPEELATFDAFQRNPQIVWEWYQHRRDIISKIKPNPGHYAIVELAALFDDFCLITQNVDSLHQEAGSSEVVELHGNIRRNRCIDCGLMNYDVEFTEFPPKCACSGRLRPDVVWFGEMLPYDALQRAQTVSQTCDLFFTVGTSGVVQPAASLPLIAKRHGAFVVEVNLGPTELSFIADQCYHGKSGEILPEIVNKIKTMRG